MYNNTSIMGSISTQDLIRDKDIFVREPADILFKQLCDDCSRKIILAGCIGTGKSTVLSYSAEQSISSQNPFIQTDFSNGRPLPKRDAIRNEAFFNTYYEILLCVNLLNYIKKHFSLTYDNYFKEVVSSIDNLYNQMERYITKSYFSAPKLEISLEIGEYSAVIIKQLKDCLNINCLTLAIDRFDINVEDSELKQITLSNFFDLFDKVIIACADHRLSQQEFRNNYINNGYSFVDVDYGMDVETVKWIIKRRFNKCREQLKSCHFGEDDFIDYMFDTLVKNAGGNIRKILSDVRMLITSQPSMEEPESFKEIFDFVASSGGFKPNESLVNAPKLCLEKSLH